MPHIKQWRTNYRYDDVADEAPSATAPRPSADPAPAERTNGTMHELAAWISEAQAYARSIRPGAILATGDTVAPRVIIVGKAPAETEQRAGRPFAGPSGDLLETMLQIAALGLHDHGGALATNASFWFAATGQAPDPKALADTAAILEGLLRKAKPKAVLALGGVAAATLIQRTDAVSKLRGRWHQCLLGNSPIPVRVTYHPAYVCREPSTRRAADADMRELHKLIGEDTTVNEEASTWLLDPLSAPRG